MIQAIGKSDDHRERLRLAARAVYHLDKLAESTPRFSPSRRLAFALKADLLSHLIEERWDDVYADWEKQPNGESLIVVAVGGWIASHCPFEKLTVQAQCCVVNQVGPGHNPKRRCG